MRHVPNALTIIRLLLVPVFAYMFFEPIPNGHFYALAIFLVAGLTDVLDGWLARKYNVISVVGIVLDPLADKLMLLTALVCLTMIGIMPVWGLWIMLAIESVQIAVGTYLYFHKEKDVIPANKFGKSATILFAAAVFLMIVLPQNPATLIVLGLAMAGKIASFASYAAHLHGTGVNKQETGKNK